jgi:hypothetical protein
MSTAPSPEMETLKTKLKTTWEAGDFSEVAKHIEKVAAEFVDRLDIKPGMKILDVACGSGNLAVNAAQQGADVTGIDIAENLVEAAKRRAEAMGLDIKFEQGDAEAMPYNDNTFDVVMTMFGAMFAPSWSAFANPAAPSPWLTGHPKGTPARCSSSRASTCRRRTCLRLFFGVCLKRSRSASAIRSANSERPNAWRI